MKTISRLDVVENDLLSWIHRDRRPVNAENLLGVRRALVNSMLIQKFDLSPLCERLVPGGVLKCVLDNWMFMPTIVEGMACISQRKRIFNQGLASKIQKKNLFFLLNDVGAQCESNIENDLNKQLFIDDIIHSQLMAFKNVLPNDIMKRMLLMFKMDGIECGLQIPFQLSNFIIVLQHVKHNEKNKYFKSH